MRVVVFRHEDGVDPGTIRPILESRGIEVQQADLFKGGSMPETRGAAGLIFLGGTMCANDDLPYLVEELRVIREAAKVGQPVFGVCLGAQMIAKALGATVHRNAVEECGWHDVEMTVEAAADPVFSRLGPVERVFQLHHDMFDLPEGAVRLAGSKACANQAFRYGEAIYGVQFHPEITPAMVEDWRREMGLPDWPETRERCPGLARLCESLFAGWSRLLGR
jgi:GMP synthase-like glutamine amidotransferase